MSSRKLIEGSEAPASGPRASRLQRFNLIESTRGRMLTFGPLYLSEGVAYGFSATAKVAFMRTEGLSLSQIGAFTAALFVPWSFKWAWAPIVDLLRLRRVGGRKAWISLCTAMMIVTLVTLALIDFRTEFRVLLWMIVLNNLFCATQDVAIDSLAVGTCTASAAGSAIVSASSACSGVSSLLTAVPKLLLAGQISAHGLSQVALILVPLTALPFVGDREVEPAPALRAALLQTDTI